MNNTHSNDGSGRTSATQLTKPLSTKTQELLNDTLDGKPIWFRSPKGGPDRWTGFSRSKLYELAGEGLIRSVSIRTPGQTKGTRLFNLQSVLDYIEGFEKNTVEQGTEAR